MIIVSDSSPLIALARIDCLKHLQSLFGTVHIPAEVERELTAKGATQGVLAIFTAMKGWLMVVQPSVSRDFPGLHPGKASAISLAIEHSSRLLIDEKAGRKVAMAQGIPVIGTIGVLLEAAERRWLDLADTFRQLKATDFRYPAAAFDQILEQFQHRQSNS